jgi:pyruvate,water dikinase
VTFWRKYWKQKQDPIEVLRERLEKFHELVEENNRVLELIAEAGEKLGGEYIFDRQYLRTFARDIKESVRRVVYNLNAITGNRYPGLVAILEAIDTEIRAPLEPGTTISRSDLVIPLDQVEVEMANMVGEKMARLGEIRKRIQCRVPDGFVISAYACQRFLRAAGIEQIMEQVSGRAAPLEDSVFAEVSNQIQGRIRQTDIPRDLLRAIQGAVARLKDGKETAFRLAVRSSAIGEDGEMSFAGQYRTVLGVTPQGVASAFKEVLAALYSPGVMRYRRSWGADPLQGTMAVGCLRMIEAASAGVVYTLDPAAAGKDVLIVAAAPGLGKTVVEGSGSVDRFEISRQPPQEVLGRLIGRKDKMYGMDPQAGIKKMDIAEERQRSPAVTEALLKELAVTALRIEKYMKCAQDIEWAADAEGRLFLLQTRPLRLGGSKSSNALDLTRLKETYPVLMSNQGEVACRGIGYGHVQILTDEDELDAVKEGVVIVSRNASPRLAGVMVKAGAMITDGGTATGHLAAIAREFRVPMIVGAGNASELLRGAGEVTVDAEDNAIYSGRVNELIHEGLLRNSSYEEAAEFRMLRRMLKKAAPLNLSDPNSSNFSVGNCATYHDIIRFAHEKSVQYLKEKLWVKTSHRSPYVSRLNLSIPLDLIIVDLDGGLRSGQQTDLVKVGDVTSAPLTALLEGLTTRGVWATEPADMDLNGFLSSATRSTPLNVPIGTSFEQNLAVVSSDYLNLMLRLGYHFNIVDCLMTESPHDNFIYFRFAGGVTEMTRRSRRAMLLKRILEQHEFVVAGRGDLVIGRIREVPLDKMVEKMRMIGRLIGFTRQLDIHLKDDSLVEKCFVRFMKGEYNSFGV